MALKVYANIQDVNDLPKSTNLSDFVELNLTSDYLIFSNGSDVVKNGEPIPSEIALIQAGAIIDTVPVIVPKYFLADISDTILKEIYNMGDKNKRYVFCFSFDAATASEPMLELWDDDTFLTTNLYSLGEGNPDNSWWWGVVTTDALPGANWLGNSPSVGSKIAGASDGHFLRLNNGNGALTAPKDLYCQLKIIIPSSFTHAATQKPVFAVKFTTN